jgi:DNA end-binding protein Ku
MARQLIDSLSSEWDPTAFKDEYRARVLELIERKAAGEDLTPPPAEAEEEKVPDLMAALEASLAALGGGKATAKSGAKKAPAKKAAAKETAKTR